MNKHGTTVLGMVAVAAVAFGVGRGNERTAEAYGGDGSCTIGEVAWFAGNFTPQRWAAANGAVMPINTNTALFSVLGTTYGGDGKTNFALSLADACLVRMSELDARATVLTLDDDFRVYRRNGRQPIPVVMPSR